VTGKLLTIVKKNLKPTKSDTTLVVSEELVYSSTGYPTFDAFDQNSNGFVEFEEFAATDGKDHKNNFQRADTNGDQKLSPEEFSRLSLIVYEPEEAFSDSDEEPPVVFLTPPESITRFTDKETNDKSESGFDDYKEMPAFISTPKEETKVDKEVKEEKKKDEKNTESKPKVDEKSLDRQESIEGSHFTADDMPVKIDDEDDEEMVDVKDEDIPVEMVDDHLYDDNRYDLEDDVREPLEDDKPAMDRMNSIE
jgi:hypothetical protein